MVSAKFTELYEKTRQIKSGPSNDELLDVRVTEEGEGKGEREEKR